MSLGSDPTTNLQLLFVKRPAASLSFILNGRSGRINPLRRHRVGRVGPIQDHDRLLPGPDTIPTLCRDGRSPPWVLISICEEWPVLYGVPVKILGVRSIRIGIGWVGKASSKHQRDLSCETDGLDEVGDQRRS